MEKGYRTIVWGMLFLTFHINVFGFEILPSFIGWLIFFYGVRRLINYEPKREWQQSGAIVLILVGITFFSMLMPILGIEMSYRTLLTIFLSVFGYILELLAEYKVLAGSISWMNQYRLHEWEREYVIKIRIYTIAVLCNIAFFCIVSTFLMKNLYILTSVIAIILKLIFMEMLNRMRRISIPKN